MEINEQVATLYNTAINYHASDIYFLPVNDQYVIKIRNSESLMDWKIMSAVRARRMMNYCKYMADMALSELRRPQIGSMDWQVADRQYSLRLSSVGDFSGAESMVVRIIYDLEEIKTAFFDLEALKKVRQMTSRRGLVIFSGPTGSGKTTTIYNLVNQTSAGKIVMTIEDPVEIKQPNYLQLQVNREAGMAYSDLIKVGLRHRPDVFIVGEIRDELTAKAAIRAALSGHLVYSTIHAQSPRGVVDRLSQLGIDRPFISQALTAVCYQRLIPTIDGQQKVLLKTHTLQELMKTNTYDWEDWQNGLEQAIVNQQITRKTAEQFWYG
ncbi:MAG: competence type IV pilus ATPase ComGA [Lentilactobacillus hilgardii]|jgi:competence protein ComGA|uniref:Competence protein ComGA n=2 Tax=Lentilactobacillus hilgardii TaxID=1588 RepID=A0A6P1E718_LENHI|nr:competence type IV pilus ATPase ComGA [Lentilactobacillus hilgardii]MCI1922758.1 Flp pilus assembly complex ATPase component TadA [Lentilactobacillus buchneri]RRG11357.1 MAG: competence protein ComGA [Lactobacillus sp.]EEI69935.1 type II/IV secretion system protein [Lentilactobacillus hilgardii ATCC 27305]MBZ2201447.1 competence protein ComGA [Lentilactobacillus hilgardii]MBZ2204362.1 competence protein ComGA [Lentilactobacillus hilgardii]